MTIKPPHDTVDFYQGLAEHYDSMTRFAERLQSETERLAIWRQKLACHSVVDVGCGTGLHSIALAKLGLQVTAIDPELAMLKVAAENAATYGVTLRLLAGTMQNLHRHLTAKQDALFCLGNTLPHLLTDRSLYAGLRSAHKVLRPGGALVIQLLNYQRILAQQERIVQINRTDETEWIRFYDFLDGRIRFNVLMIQGSCAPFHHRLFSTLLRPYQRKELHSTLQACGFAKIAYYANLEEAPYQRFSPNLVICAFKK